MTLKNRFIQICFNFTQNQILIDDLWYEIEKKYSEKGRYYHNKEHLENMFCELELVKDKIQNFKNITFSVFYHDVIYDATSKLNEEKSAEFAKIKLEKLGLNTNDIAEISKQILATKSHKKSENDDINYLLDADLSVLGKDPETYLEYTKNIRREYSIYPDFLYKPGRKKVLQHFLELDSIFKTEDFIERYEIQAKENISMELNDL
ncbi:hypothetical protein CHRY9390_00556 [Chryseobacterium aquaeductus]|uniref:Metal-dependent HD superfamily phosphohydrolase n=1 Tax=Chryseobacterium aquaeductus TaxID=2675056 RepID=A0A9N8QR41_9FLAO|nr:hypothetical protein [Chryseobacterium aquaeductus]CAA7329907.1 hypothetical protein CHRY9390_00556 [Chryseobacterium potabilaquae]CAD7799920.1 hypothetical protein CHRY9390_00556 [Chryseobacterium aquaeductus]